MTPELRKINPDLNQWLETRLGALKIVKTTKTPSGQILDWIPIESQEPEGKIATPPPTHPQPVYAEDKLRPVHPAVFELEDPAVERGPAGTVPIARPDLSVLGRTIPVNEYLRKRGGAIVNKYRPNKTEADPNPFGYFHCIDSQSVKCYGCDGFLNVWDPAINNPSSPGDDHSIMQTWLQNYDQQTQSVEAGWTIDKNLNGDTIAHVFTYYTTNGYSADGNGLGGYNSIYSGWKQYSNWAFPGIRINGVSTPGGQQLEISIKYQLYEGNWWFAAQGVWFGYYPASLFTSRGNLGNNAEWVGFGGEVFSSLANPSLTKDQMGSGRKALDGWTHAAYQRNLRTQSAADGTMANSNGTAQTDTANGGVNPYTIQMDMNSGSSWQSYFYVGGPAA